LPASGILTLPLVREAQAWRMRANGPRKNKGATEKNNRTRKGESSEQTLELFNSHEA